MLTYGAVTAGVVLAAPTLISLSASPASASGAPSDQSASASNSANITSLTTSTMSEPLGILIATVALQSNDQTITAPEGWTALSKSATTSATGAARITAQQFYIYYSEVAADQTYQFSWPTACAGAISIVKFPTASVVVESSAAALSSSGTSRTCNAVTPSVPSGADGPPGILLSLAYSRVTASPTPSAPSDTTNGTYTEYAVGRNNNVGSQQFVFYPAATSSSGTITVGSMVNGRASVLRAIVVT